MKYLVPQCIPTTIKILLINICHRPTKEKKFIKD